MSRYSIDFKCLTQELAVMCCMAFVKLGNRIPQFQFFGAPKAEGNRFSFDSV